MDDLDLPPTEEASSDTARGMVGSDEVGDPPPGEEFVAAAGPCVSSSFLFWSIFLFLVFFMLTEP